MSNEEIIQLKILGENNEPVPLHSAVNAISEFHHMVDKSIITISGKGKLSRKDRESYKIVALNLKTGSILADLAIVLPPAMQVGFAFQAASTGLTVKNVWELTKNSFGLLKVIAEYRQKGKHITITQHTEPFGFSVIAQDNATVNILVGDKIHDSAFMMEQHVKKLASHVGGRGGIGEFNVIDSLGGINLTPKDNKLFNPKTYIDKNAIEINAKLYKLDVESKNGRLRVLDGQLKGEYSYKIIGNQQIGSYINALGKSSTQLIALREVIKHPTNEETIASFHIIDIIGLSGNLFG